MSLLNKSFSAKGDTEGMKQIDGREDGTLTRGGLMDTRSTLHNLK